MAQVVTVCRVVLTVVKKSDIIGWWLGEGGNIMRNCWPIVVDGVVGMWHSGCR